MHIIRIITEFVHFLRTKRTRCGRCSAIMRSRICGKAAKRRSRRPHCPPKGQKAAKKAQPYLRQSRKKAEPPSALPPKGAKGGEKKRSRICGKAAKRRSRRPHCPPKGQKAAKKSAAVFAAKPQKGGAVARIAPRGKRRRKRRTCDCSRQCGQKLLDRCAPCRKISAFRLSLCPGMCAGAVWKTAAGRLGKSRGIAAKREGVYDGREVKIEKQEKMRRRMP